ncbi:MAG: histidine phosphatase family protein [Elusimicrobia bacterium]|nr:histidine phosphatase family protein [Elusimicrobiota bacterium]
MKLWLVRHARPQIELSRCYGKLDVEPVAGSAEASAGALAAALPPGLATRVSSRSRAQRLAQALADLRPDLRPETDPRLDEMDFGAWEGVPWAEIPREELGRWTADFNGYRCGGGESVGRLVARVADALDEMRPLGEAVWLTHAGVIKAVQHLAKHGRAPVEGAAAWPAGAPDFGGWLELTL